MSRSCGCWVGSLLIKTIADFRKDNGLALRKVCARFVELCREMGLLATTSVAIDGSKFKAGNNRDRNFTRAKVERRRAQLEESVARYLSQLDTADRQEPTEALERRITRWEHEHVLEEGQRRLDNNPQAMRQRHPFGTIKARMGATHFLTKTLPKVAAEMALWSDQIRRGRGLAATMPSQRVAQDQEPLLVGRPG
jgi:hypothetical protein